MILWDSQSLITRYVSIYEQSISGFGQSLTSPKIPRYMCETISTFRDWIKIVQK
jgi:hypothetical protein